MLLIIYIPTNAQSKKHVTGLLGYSDDGFATLASFAFSTSDTKYDFFEASIYSAYLTERKTAYNIPVTIHSLNLGYFKKLDFLSFKRDFILFHGGLGGIIGTESINNNSNELPNGALITSNDGVIYGGFAALQGDLFLNDKLRFITRYKHFYHANSDINKSKFFIGAGLKFLIF